MTADRRDIRTSKDIDRLVDEALLHPERAQRIKDTLRQKVLGTDDTRRPATEAASASYDLWDNVPV